MFSLGKHDNSSIFATGLLNIATYKHVLSNKCHRIAIKLM